MLFTVPEIARNEVDKSRFLILTANYNQNKQNQPKFTAPICDPTPQGAVKAKSSINQYE